MHDLLPVDVQRLVQGALPEVDLDALARETGALRRTREVKTGAELLEMCLVHSLNAGSLRTTAAIFTGLHRPISDVGVLYRLGLAAPLLREVLNRLLVPGEFQHRAVDASVMMSPGATTSDWRLHLVLGLGRNDVQPVAFDFTPAGGPGSAEQLMRAPHPPGSILLADRGMSSATQLAAARDDGQHVMVRVSLNQLACYAPGGDRIAAGDLIAGAKTLLPGQCREWAIEVRTPQRTAVALRLIACRLSEPAAQREQKKVAARASRKGNRKPRATTKAQSEWLWVVTSLPPETYSTEDAAMLYRLRWQIETYFKHLKSDLGLGEVRAKKPEQVETWVLSKLLLAVLATRFRRVLFPLRRSRLPAS